jgi:hypothetical protein
MARKSRTYWNAASWSPTKPFGLGEPFWAEDRSGPAQMPTQAPMAVVYLWRAVDAEGQVLDVAGSN